MDSQDIVHVLDFSDLEETGTFTIRAEDGQESRTFNIGDSKTWSALLYDSLNYFYQNRSGIAIEEQYITSGDAARLARAAGHKPDSATVEKSGQTQDVTGGWYDAGDYGKYTTTGAIAAAELLLAYEAHPDHFAKGQMVFPAQLARSLSGG